MVKEEMRGERERERENVAHFTFPSNRYSQSTRWNENAMERLGKEALVKKTLIK